MTLSSTLSAGNGRTIWKVRPMPRRQMRSGGKPSMRSPAKLMVPPSGANTPAIMLNSVVLPAPFGPITAKMPPSGTSKLKLVDREKPAEAFADAFDFQKRAHVFALRQVRAGA